MHLIEKTVQEELSDLDLVLLDDSKNYHAWQHRIWLVQHSHLISKLYKKEYQVAEYMICRDVFNNSAWNYRIFLRSLTANSDKDSILKDNESFDLQNLDEKFTSDMIDMCPQNISPWRYLRVIMQWSPNQQLLDQLLLKYPKEFERFYY